MKCNRCNKEVEPDSRYEIESWAYSSFALGLNGAFKDDIYIQCLCPDCFESLANTVDDFMRYAI